MANIEFRTDKDILYISLTGRIDATNAADVESGISEIRNANTGMHTVLDADTLEYISSAGLRVILRLRKEESQLAIINVSPEVYDVFEMTGFAEMMTVEKTYPRISLDGCEFIAKGANGAVYRYDDETIVKQYFNRDALPEIMQERENSRRAFVLGVNTAIPYGIVRIGDGYGSLTELLNATSVTKLIRANKEDLTQSVAYFVDTLKEIHSTEVEEGALPDFKKWVLEWADFLSSYLDEANAQKMRTLIEGIPDSNYMIHGDYHSNNVMVQNGEPILIDMDTLAVGHPVLELGSTFNAYVGFSELDKTVIESFLGIDVDTAREFWNLSLARYLGTDDKNAIEAVENKAKVIGYMRLLRRCLRRDGDEATVNHYRTKLIEVLNKVDTLEF
ncbi:MAG: anti-sigma factor antagonist [Acutalibacteraceae bacterium]|nr:anti-sigma factor antagonist [Acutalibacteraceae bacterium]